jgi:mannose-6-phosphate isomerase-like protein (cupin superfamily)
MPVFRSGETPPLWSELRFFEIVRLAPGKSHIFERKGSKEKLVVGAGACRLKASEGDAPVEAAEKGRGEFKFALDSADGQFAVQEALEPVTLIRMAGTWGEETGGYGVFSPKPAGETAPRGDDVSYPKATSFDNHFHDCDEYWIVYEGRGVVYSEGKRYEVGPGDCIATGMGDHHDFPETYEPVRAVFLETTLEGQRRPRHLWEHTHGKAQPQRE